MILRCSICKLYFDAHWVGDEIQIVCDDCWEREFRDAEVIPFRRPA